MQKNHASISYVKRKPLKFDKIYKLVWLSSSTRGNLYATMD